MAIAFDAASNSTYQTAQSSYSWSHTCTGTNGYLFVSIAMLSVLGTNVSSITYNGVKLIQIIDSATQFTGAIRTEIWGLANPATGTNTIAITLTAGLDSVGMASSFTGVNQALSTEGEIASGATNGLSPADATLNVQTIGDNDWIIDSVATSDTSITVQAGETSRNNVSGTLGSGAMGTRGPITPPASQAMGWTNVGAAQSWAIAAVAIRPTADVSDFVYEEEPVNYIRRYIW